MSYRILDKIRDCSKVGLHAWYDTNLGYPIRKPNIDKLEHTLDMKIIEVEPTEDKLKFFQRILLWLSKCFVIFVKRK